MPPPLPSANKVWGVYRYHLVHLSVSALHTKIAFYPRMILTLILDKFKVTRRKSAIFVSGLYLAYGETFEVLTSNNECLWPDGELILTQVHLGSFKVIGRKFILWVCSYHYFEETLKVPTSHKDYL